MQKIKSLIAKSKVNMNAKYGSLNASEARSLDLLLLEQKRRSTDSFVRASTPIFILAAISMAALAPDYIKSSCIAPFVGVTMLNLIWLTYFRSNVREPKPNHFLAFHVAIHMIAIAGFASVLGFVLNKQDLNRSYLVIFGLIYGAVGLNISHMNPAFKKSNIGLTFVHVIFGIMVWHINGANFLLSWSLVLLLTDLLGLFFVFIQANRNREHAVIEMRSTALEGQNRLLKIKAMESDLALANQIQQSLAPPPDTIKTGPFSLRFYRASHGPLGGDWCAVRVLANNSIVIAVGDVTGKGLPAAMVLQAVQALWASILKQPTFAPESWIHSVNDTLLMMGEREPHSLTLGILILEYDKMTYYSAGHVPILIRPNTFGSEDIRVVHGTGNVLGLQERCELTPVVVHFNPDLNQSILLGTDGIIGWELRRRKKFALQLFEELAKTGQPNFEAIKSNDDKTLVWIEYSPTHLAATA